MPRFVVLEHDSPRDLHWDFMLEMGSALSTWALAEPPNASPRVDARRLPDHRSAYLDYEGPVSGQRGHVSRWDHGSYEIEHQTESELVVTLSGEKLTGRASLRRVSQETDQWHFRLASCGS
jgi:hypothetical protein